MYRSASEAYQTPRYLKPWSTVCVAASEQHEAPQWEARKPSANQIVKAIRKGLHK
jgi:hypothetical protein